MTRQTVDTVRSFEVEGDDRERGLRQGRLFVDRIDAMYGSLARLPMGWDWLPVRAREGLSRLGVGGLGRFYLPMHRPLLRRHAGGRHVRVLEGLAEGFGVHPSTIYGFHTFEIESGIVGFRMGCTALGFRADQTDTGRPKLAYNHDFPSAFRPHLVLRRSLPDRGAARTLCLTYEVMIGAIAGLNEHGLAVTVNQAFARRPRRLRPGLLPSILVQDCLDHCRTVAEAVARLNRLPVPVGSLLTLVDATGDRAAVELAPRGHAVRGAQGDAHGGAQGSDRRDARILYTFNHYRCPSTVAQEIPNGAQGTGLASGYDLHEANRERERRFLTLVETKPQPCWTDDRIHALLADHDGGVGGANTICRHDPLLGGDTIVSAILDPQARSIRICHDWPCQGDHGRPISL